MLAVPLKEQLETMSNDIGITQNNITVLALHSLINNYNDKGSGIFMQLIDINNND